MKLGFNHQWHESQDRFLRSAVKVDNMIHVGHQGEMHSMVAARHGFSLRNLDDDPDSHYQLGFVDHRNRFHDRESAMDYARQEDLIKPQSPAQQKWLQDVGQGRELMADIMHYRKFPDRRPIKVQR
jgi:hypothetical protein